MNPRVAPAGVVTVPGGRNVVMAALTGPHERFALRHGTAVRYRPTVAPFATLPDEPTTSDWADLATLAGDRSVVLIRPQPPRPPGWEQVAGWPVFQLVYAAGVDVRTSATAGTVSVRADGPEPELDDDMEILDSADVAEMRELVRITRPGPFLAETIKLGRYLGIREDGRLVAMAGERFRVPGACEISAICTHPSMRGQGLAERLTMTVTRGILARGEVPFLHVITDNTPAIRLYEKLGFTVSLTFDALAVRAPGSGPADTSELTVH